MHEVRATVPLERSGAIARIASWHFAVPECSVSSREVRAIVDAAPLAEITRPMVEPAPDILEDLWQLSHVTPSYLGRAAGGAILLADGVLHDSAISIVVAALFLPFLSQVLAVGFGAWCGDIGLVRKDALALLTSAVLGYGAGVAVALIAGGAIAFHGFKGPLASFAIPASSARPLGFRPRMTPGDVI